MQKHIFTIQEIKEIVAPLARAYGIKKITLFGSYARGEATEKSDIDLLIVDRGSLGGYFKLAGFYLDLEEKFGIHVDVLTIGALDDDFLARIRGEQIVVFDDQTSKRGPV